jgi:hypothetical protein
LASTCSLCVRRRPAATSHGLQLLLWVSDRRSRCCLMRGLRTHPCEALYRLQGPFQPHRRDSYHMEPLLHRCSLLYRGVYAVPSPGRRNGTSSSLSHSTCRLLLTSARFPRLGRSF